MHESVRLARELIAIPSVNPMGTGMRGDLYSERGVALYVHDYCKQIGMDTEVVGEVFDHPNVLASVQLGLAETVLLEAHMDTVSHEQMTISPFEPLIRDGLLFGRGSCDTKSSLAVYLAVAKKILTSGARLKRNFVIAGVHDEEYSFGGSRELVARGIEATFAIAGEPTGLNIIYAHKGVCRFHLHTKGLAAHAALPWLGDSAIYRMADVLKEIQLHSEELLSHSHPELGPATINVGRVHGGEAVNIVPPGCTIDVDRRLLPGESFESIVALLGKRLSKFNSSVTIDPPYLLAAGVYNARNSGPCQALLDASKAVNWSPQFETAHYGTDASIFCEAGIPTAVFGPGSVSLAHTKAEYVPIKEIEQAYDIMFALLTEE